MIERVAIIGLDTVGAGYARQISKYAPSTMLFGVVRNLESYWGAPIMINNEALRINYRTVDTLTDIDFDLVILCMKSYQFQEIMESVRPLISANTMVLSFAKGIGVEQQIDDFIGQPCTVNSVISGMKARRNGHCISIENPGMLYLDGSDEKKHQKAEQIGNFLVNCKIPCKLTKRISYYMWRQMLLDVSYEETSLVFQLPNHELFGNKYAMDIMRASQRELVALANACHVPLQECDIDSAEQELKKLPDDSRSGMQQDYWLNRRLETDALCDFVSDLAQKKGVAVPANIWLQEETRKMIKKRGELPTGESEVRGLCSRQGYLAAPEKIANQLRIDIMKAKFQANEKLSENELAARFQVSRSSVRTALQILSNEGLLRTLPNGRKEVSGFTEKQLRDLFDVRWLIENQALTLLFEREQTVYPQLAEVLGQIEQNYRFQDLNMEMDDLDILFHRNLVKSADNMFLLNAFEGISQLLYAAMSFHSSLWRDTLYAMEFFNKHKRIYELLLAKDRSAFPELRRHIEEEKEMTALIIEGFRE